VWEWVTDPSAPGPYTAAFAYLTAYGRLHMRRLRALCPPHTVYQQDTDGLWVHPVAVDALAAAGVPFGDSAGDLRVAAVVEAAQFLAPRHYWTSDGWVLAGFSSPRVRPGGTTVVDTYSRSPLRSGERSPPAAVWTFERECDLRPDPGPGAIDPLGWHHPPYRG
jgi:hypothetical protein